MSKTRKRSAATADAPEAAVAKNQWFSVPPSQGGPYDTEQEARDALSRLKIDPRNAEHELDVWPPHPEPIFGKWKNGWIVARRFRPEVWAERQRILQANAERRKLEMAI